MMQIDRPRLIIPEDLDPPSVTYLGNANKLHIMKGSKVEIIIEDGADVVIRTVRSGKKKEGRE